MMKFGRLCSKEDRTGIHRQLWYLIIIWGGVGELVGLFVALGVGEGVGVGEAVGFGVGVDVSFGVGVGV